MRVIQNTTAQAGEEKILTKHPLGKNGKNIDRQKYEAVREAILAVLRNRQLTHT